MEMTIEKMHTIIVETHMAAYNAAERYFNVELGGEDKYACGFAWVDICEYNGKRIKGNTKMGRMLKECGIGQSHTRTFQIWNPARYPVQNVDTLLAGAEAAAKVLRSHGFKAYAGSRLD